MVNYKPSMGHRADVSPDPIQLLKSEHHTTLQWLEMIERTLQYLGSLPKNTAAARREIEQRRLRDCVISLEKAIVLHFVKEEEALFPVLARYISCEEGPIEVMLREHDHLRAIFYEWRKRVSRLCAGGPGGESRLRAVASCGYEAIRLLRLHISKENQILFEICEAALSPEEKLGVAEKLKALGPRPFGKAT